MLHEILLLNLAFKKPEALALLRPDWRKENERSGIPSTGFCYIATEALYHMLGGRSSGLKPYCAVYEEGTHWWLEDETGKRLDPTSSQYGEDDPPYHLGKGCGFQNGHGQPSKRAASLMRLCAELDTDPHISEAGRSARFRGATFKDNPYTFTKTPEQWVDWFTGWREADRFAATLEGEYSLLDDNTHHHEDPHRS